MKHLVITCLLVLTVGCGSTPETQYYILSAEHSSVVSKVGGDRPVIGIAEVRLADYLGTSRIAMVSDDSTVHSAVYHRWAEPLRHGVRRCLATNLSRELPEFRVESRARRQSQGALRIDLEVDVFHATTAGFAVLSGRGVLRHAHDDRIVSGEDFRLRESLEGSGYPAAVAAQSRLLRRLGKSISRETLANAVPGHSPDGQVAHGRPRH